MKKSPKRYLLRLYISGSTLKSTRAVANVKRVCERYLKDEYDLEVIDVYQQANLAKEEQILTVPILVKRRPLPRRKIVGDLSRPKVVILGLGLEV